MLTFFVFSGLIGNLQNKFNFIFHLGYARKKFRREQKTYFEISQK